MTGGEGIVETTEHVSLRLEDSLERNADLCVVAESLDHPLVMKEFI